MITFNEKELWAHFKDRGDAGARETLILHHMRIVRYVAGRMAIHVPANVEMHDLVGWGVLGLLDAVEKFDHQQDIKFTTYATIRVRGAIIDQIRALDWAPRSLRTMARRVRESREKLRQQQGLEPDSDAIAEDLGTTPELVEDTMAQLQTAHVLSLDNYLPSDDQEDVRKIDIVTNSNASSPMHAAMEKEKQELLVKAILNLPDQQQKVLNLYYFEELTLKEIGLVLNVSESRICQIHSAAMKALRKFVREQE